ncbi:hypothetical protein E2N92_01370 [Methanofollis formosanus]|uniref:Uncharacterized protein n=1 Tax=Methanofollis formosanus TaxID=299308 RepID=A0A8G1A076_9EURY|nr:hypothetical protein [Methanofollis formosanus]QYZ78175.1 hypothetical protein E2N92_01370 [Methanofollis formosanus]
MTNEKRDRNVRRGLLIIGIAFLLFVAYAGYGLYRESTDPPYSIHLFPVNESETEDGVIVHLTEEDFERWPSLEKAIKEDRSPSAPELTNSSRRSEFGDEYMHNDTVDRPIYVEYEGKYFRIRISIR